MVRGALFKRIEEEKGLGGLAPAPGRGIRTVLISDSAICFDVERLRCCALDVEDVTGQAGAGERSA